MNSIKFGAFLNKWKNLLINTNFRNLTASTQGPKNILELDQEARKNFLNSFDTVLCDCDGVLWHQHKPLENAGLAINKLQKANKKVAFVSNNSGRSDKEYETLFKMCNIECDLRDLCHPVKNIVAYLKSKNFDGLIYTIGSNTLNTKLKNAGFKVIEESKYIFDNEAQNEIFLEKIKNWSIQPNIGAVILHGYWNISSVDLMKAQIYLIKNPGCLFIMGTCSMIKRYEDLKLLGPGVFAKILCECTGRTPVQLSKPGHDLGDFVMKKFQINKPERVLMIGDTLSQDIAFGKICGFQTMAVLTGATDIDDFKYSKNNKLLPDFYSKKLSEFVFLFDSQTNLVNNSNLKLNN